MPDLARHHLVDGGAGIDIGPRRLLDANSGQKCAAGPGMVAGTVRSRIGTHVVQSGKNLHLVTDVAEGLQGWREFEVAAAVTFRPPCRWNGAVGHVQKRHAGRCGGSGGRARCGRSGERAQ